MKQIQINTILNKKVTAEMVNDLIDTHHKKPNLALQTSKALTYMTDNPLDDFSDNQTNSINDPTGITYPQPFYSKRPNRLHMTRFKLFPKSKQFHQPKIIQRTSTLHSTLHSSLQQHPTTLPNYSSVNTTPNDNIVDNTPVTDSPIKIHSKTNYSFPPSSF